MSDNKEHAHGQENTGDIQPCCSTTPDECGCSSAPASRPIKTIIFVIVLLLATAIAAHSIIKNNKIPDSPEDLNLSLNIEPVNINIINKNSNSQESEKTLLEPEEQLQQKIPTLCGTKLTSLAELNNLAADKKAVFILLVGDSEKAAENAGKVVEQTTKIITDKGTPVATFTLDSDKADYGKLIQAFSIKSFPSIVVMGKGAGVSVVSGDINETNLLTAFVKATTISCGPRKGSGCCPK